MLRREARPQPPPPDSAPHRYLSPQDGCWHIHIAQGQNHVTASPREMLTTVLGSCIAACIRDPFTGIGGMNHFLLPEDRGGSDASRYGVNAMEILINGLLNRGAARHRLEAKLFGGANVIPGLSSVGSANAAFARQFLSNEGIPMIGGDVGGTFPRRVQYWPAIGRALQRSLPLARGKALVEEEMALATRSVTEVADVELF